MNNTHRAKTSAIRVFSPVNVFVVSPATATKTEQSAFTSCGWIISAKRDLQIKYTKQVSFMQLFGSTI